MSAVMMSVEFDSAKERRVLLCLVLVGHMFLIGALALKQTLQPPKPLSIELSLSAPELSQQVQAQPPVPKPTLALRSAPAPASKSMTQTAPSAPEPTPAPTPVSVPAAVPTHSAASPSQSTPSPAPAKVAPAQAAPTVPPNADAAYLTNPKPAYPPLSRRLGEQGVVTLSVLVGEDGEVQKLEVAQTSGHERLDVAAQKAVQGWRFAPGKRAGVTQAMWVKVPISFILEKR